MMIVMAQLVIGALMATAGVQSLDVAQLFRTVQHNTEPYRIDACRAVIEHEGVYAVDGAQIAGTVYSHYCHLFIQSPPDRQPMVTVIGGSEMAGCAGDESLLLVCLKSFPHNLS